MRSFPYAPVLLLAGLLAILLSSGEAADITCNMTVPYNNADSRLQLQADLDISSGCLVFISNAGNAGKNLYLTFHMFQPTGSVSMSNRFNDATTPLQVVFNKTGSILGSFVAVGWGDIIELSFTGTAVTESTVIVDLSFAVGCEVEATNLLPPSPLYAPSVNGSDIQCTYNISVDLTALYPDLTGVALRFTKFALPNGALAISQPSSKIAFNLTGMTAANEFLEASSFTMTVHMAPGLAQSFAAGLVPMTCGGRLTVGDDLVNVTSPGYPLPYEPNTYCLWDMQTANASARLEFTVPALEFGDTLTTVQIYEGTENADRYVIAILTGDSPPTGKFVTAGSAGRVFFFASAFKRGGGFSLTARQTFDNRRVLLDEEVTTIDVPQLTSTEVSYQLWAKSPSEKVVVDVREFSFLENVTVSITMYDGLSVIAAPVLAHYSAMFALENDTMFPVYSIGETMTVLISIDDFTLTPNVTISMTAASISDTSNFWVSRQSEGSIQVNVPDFTSEDRYDWLLPVDERPGTPALLIQVNQLTLPEGSSLFVTYENNHTALIHNASASSSHAFSIQVPTENLRLMVLGKVPPSWNDSYADAYADSDEDISSDIYTDSGADTGGLLTMSASYRSVAVAVDVDVGAFASGSIASPGFPNRYPMAVPEAQSKWTFLAQPTKYLYGTFFPFSLYVGDVLAVTAGGKSVATLHRDHDLLVPFSQGNMSNNVEIAMETSSLPGAGGFQMMYQVVGCGGVLTANGSVATPGYPATTASGSVCIWKVELPQTTTKGAMTTMMVTLDKMAGQGGATLSIKDGDAHASPQFMDLVLGRSKTAQSSNNTIVIKYNFTSTDPKAKGQPFKLTVEEKLCTNLCDANTTCIKDSWLCNGRWECKSGADELGCATPAPQGPTPAPSGAPWWLFALMVILAFVLGILVVAVVPRLRQRFARRGADIEDLRPIVS